MSLPTDNLLSAFHDGEMTPAERAAVEQRLAASADARCELSEFKQISALLKELPRDRLPSEFPQQVLQAIEREMLIPSQPVDPTDAARTPSSRRWIGAAAVLTSAAGLLLLVRALDDRAGRDVVQGQRLAGMQNVPAAPVEVAADSPVLMAANDSVSLVRKSDVAAGTAGQNSVVANALRNTFTRARIAGGASGDKFVLDQSALHTADVGEVVRAIEQTEGDEVAVVFLTVVDRQEGLNGLQLLLTKNRFTRSEEEANDGNGGRLSSPAGDADEMQAVLVKSDAAQLATALQQLGQEKYLHRLEVDQPILLAELNEARGGRAMLAGKAISADAKREHAKSLPDSATAARRAKTALPEIAEKKAANPATAPKADEARDAQEPFANQVRFGVSAQLLQQNQVAQQSRTRSLSKETLRGPAAAEKDADATVNRRSLQVLFVVVDQSQAAKPQTSPANSSKPAAVPAKARNEPAQPKGQDGAA